MTTPVHRNRVFAESLIRRFDPSFRQRWEIYDGIIARLSGPGTRWLDGGCGNNIAVTEFPCALTVGMDAARHPSLSHDARALFVMGDLDRIPFRDGAFTLVTLNTVAEHFRDPAAAFREIRRVLAPGGHLLIHTTNVRSPLIFLGKLLPQSVRMRLFTAALGAAEEDVFPAYHRVNSRRAIRNIEGFEVGEFHAVQDLNWSRRPVFLGLFAYHLLSRLPGLRGLRTNFVALLVKKNEPQYTPLRKEKRNE